MYTVTTAAVFAQIFTDHVPLFLFEHCSIVTYALGLYSAIRGLTALIVKLATLALNVYCTPAFERPALMLPTEVATSNFWRSA
jgi:hypothetical protein